MIYEYFESEYKVIGEKRNGICILLQKIILKCHSVFTYYRCSFFEVDMHFSVKLKEK